VGLAGVGEGLAGDGEVCMQARRLWTRHTRRKSGAQLLNVLCADGLVDYPENSSNQARLQPSASIAVAGS
jgi:hypothetical protein